MARNHEVTTKHDLLNADGTLREPGWSKSLIQTYNRESIAAPKFKIKEWDYYLILADKHAVAFTLSDDGYIGMQSASLLVFDEKNPWEQTSSILNFFPMGKYKLPRTSETGNISYHDKKLDLDFIVTAVQLCSDRGRCFGNDGEVQCLGATVRTLVCNLDGISANTGSGAAAVAHRVVSALYQLVAFSVCDG